MLTAEQQKLIEDNMDFYYYWFNLHNVYDEDRQQSLLLKLVENVHLYDSSRGAFTTFVGVVFKTRIAREAQELNTKKRIGDKYKISLNTVLYDDPESDSAVTIEDLIGTDDTDFHISIENQILFENIAKHLSKDRTITAEQIKRFYTYLQVGTFEAAGKLFNVSGEAIRQNFNRVIATIKEHKLYNDKMKLNHIKYSTLTELIIDLKKYNLDKFAKPFQICAKVVPKNPTSYQRNKNELIYEFSSNSPAFIPYSNDSTIIAKAKSNKRKQIKFDKLIDKDLGKYNLEYCYIESPKE